MRSLQSPCLVSEDAHLDCTLANLSRSAVGIDTEFVRESTYYPKLGLIQLFDGQDCVLVDPLSITNKSYFRQFAAAVNSQFIIHSGRQDLAILYDNFGVALRPFDTQIAAALCGHSQQISYAGLVRALLDIEINKEHSRTNWLRRPLSQAQLDYAANDVRHLLDLRSILKDQLSHLDRLAWAQEEMEQAAVIASHDQSLHDIWCKLKSLPKLDAVQQQLSYKLVDWRESKAMDANKPRQWILADAQIIAICTHPPSSEAQLRHQLTDCRHLGKKDVAALMQLILSNGEERNSLPLSNDFRRPTEEERAKTKQLAAITHSISKELGLEPSVLLSKGKIKKLVADPPSFQNLTQWRQQVLGDSFFATLTI